MKFAAFVLATLSTFAAVQGDAAEDYAKCIVYIYGDSGPAMTTRAEVCDAAASTAHCGKKVGYDTEAKALCDQTVIAANLLTGDTACEADCSGAFSIKTGILATTALALLTSVVGLSL